MKLNSYKLFLDDVRQPKRGTWSLARSFEEALDIVDEKGMPNIISFDHDLGEGKTGDDFAKWLIEQHLNGDLTFPERFEFIVHSANPVGKKNIESRLNNFLKHIRKENG